MDSMSFEGSWLLEELPLMRSGSGSGSGDVKWDLVEVFDLASDFVSDSLLTPPFTLDLLGPGIGMSSANLKKKGEFFVRLVNKVYKTQRHSLIDHLIHLPSRLFVLLKLRQQHGIV